MELKEWGSELNDLLDSVTNPGAEAKLRTWLLKLSEEGSDLRRSTRALGDGLFELKVDHCGMAYRCVYCFHQGAIVFLVCFVKKKQKDQRKIELARKRLRAIKSIGISKELSNVTIH